MTSHRHEAQLAVAGALQLARSLADAIERIHGWRSGALPPLLGLVDKAESLTRLLMAGEYHREFVERPGEADEL